MAYRACTLALMTLAATFVGCGDDGDGKIIDAAADDAVDATEDATEDPSVPDAMDTACRSAGAATVTGTIAGESIEPTAAWYGVHPQGLGYVLAFSEQGSLCFEESTEGEDVAFAFCAPIEAGTYTVVAPDDFPDRGQCTDRIAAVVVEETVGDLASGIGGTITIESASSCAQGTFDINFDTGDTLTGSFSAITCDAR